MGMFQNEEQYEDKFERGEEIILHGIEYTGTIDTEVGPAERTVVDVETRDGTRGRFSVLGVGIMNQAKRTEPSDFPSVAKLVENPHKGGRTLKTFELVAAGGDAVREWKNAGK